MSAVSFVALGASALGFRLGVAWLPRLGAAAAAGRGADHGGGARQQRSLGHAALGGAEDEDYSIKILNLYKFYFRF